MNQDVPTIEPRIVVTPTFSELVATFTRIGLLSFGGPAGQIALMHKVLVDEKKWIDEPRYLAGLNFCMLLPGPEAMQLATYVGWRLHGVAGGLAAGLLFVLPGALVMLALSMAYAAFGRVPVVEAFFVGVKAAVLAIVVEALLRVARRALRGPVDWLTAAVAFVAIFALKVPFPVIVIAAALLGFARGGTGSALPAADTGAPPATIGGTVGTAILWGLIWALPLLAVATLFGSTHILSEMAVFFSKLAVVTFGGAYAVLAYMAQAVATPVEMGGRGWLSTTEMVDGLGLAETTPGPLILVLQFVGYLAASRLGGGDPLLMGTLGAVLTLWATFAPCFLWIFAGAPWIERINAEPRLRGALSAVTAAVVGVILNLTVWFAVHVLFARVGERSFGPVDVMWPDPASLDAKALGLGLLAVALMFGLHRGLLTTLASCAVAGLGLHVVLG